MRCFLLPFLALSSAIAIAPETVLARAPSSLQIAAIGDIAPSRRQQDQRPNALVLKIQSLLAEFGIYQGPVDGIMGPQTERAIRIFQKSRGLRVNGEATEELAHTLETDEKVDQLLQRLQTVRESKIEAARQALLSDPRTRHLIEDANKDETADPTRDSEPCFRAPSPTCLLVEAAESSKAIFKDELRDWALGEILAAQARAGLSGMAMKTARRISDPRLVMVALREIAEALATAGETQEAMNAADIIPDRGKKLDAYGSIAAIQVSLNGSGQLGNVIQRINALLDEKKNDVEIVSHHARFATMFHSIGRDDTAKDYLRQAEARARRLSSNAKSTALRHIAIARAELADPDSAMRLLDDVKGSSDRMPILTSAAKALARNGAADEALKTASDIEAPRYRAVALSDVAGLLAHKGETDKAAIAIADAQALLDDIKLPYARSYAASRIALALLDIATASGGNFTNAVKAAESIKDDTLRAYTLWSISTEQRRAGEKENASFTETLARESVAAIKSRLSRVWLYGDLVAGFAAAGEMEPAWRAFHDGLDMVRTINNAWARSRALAKLSNALAVLTEPEAPHGKVRMISIPDHPIPNGAPPPAQK